MPPNEVRSLLAYEEDEAGGLMNSRLIAVKETDTADAVISHLRSIAPPEDESYYLYVVDSDNRLRGVLSLRDLIVAQPDARVDDLHAARRRLRPPRRFQGGGGSEADTLRPAGDPGDG